MAGGDLAPAGGGVSAAHGGALVLSFPTLLLVLDTRGWLVISTAQRKASFHEDPARAARSALRRYRGGSPRHLPVTRPFAASQVAVSCAVSSPSRCLWPC